MLQLAGALALSTLLVACGEEQTAQNNPAQNSHTRNASTSTTQTATPAAPVAPEGTVRTVAPSADQTTGSINRTDAGSGPFAAAIGKNFTGGPISVQFGADQRFTMRDRNGQTVTGRYAQADGIVTFQDGQGDTTGARFPMRCRFETQQNDGFRLSDSGDGSCPHFADVTFKPGT
jgi:hypothetical protein